MEPESSEEEDDDEDDYSDGEVIEPRKRKPAAPAPKPAARPAVSSIPLKHILSISDFCYNF